MSLRILLLPLLALCALAQQCSMNVSMGMDFKSTVRVPSFPNGTTQSSWQECCALCPATTGCTGWVFMTKETLCFPLATYTLAQTPNPDRVLGVFPPSPPPPEWVSKIEAMDMLYASSDATIPVGIMPMVGNGFLATQLTSDSLFVEGIFNGEGLEAGSHRARIPATFAVPAPGDSGPAALDVREATYFRRSFVFFEAGCSNQSQSSCTTAPGNVTVEQRFYAHRALPSVAVFEVQVLNAPAGSFTALRLINEGGAPSTDFNFTSVPVSPGAPYSVTQGWTQGTECPPNTCGPNVTTSIFGTAVLTTDLPPGGMLYIPTEDPTATYYYLTVVRTTIETQPATAGALVAAAQIDFANATALATAGLLHASHINEWAQTIWSSGFSTDRRDFALAVNTSIYSLLSSLRPDRPYSTSPGGLANDGYNGHSFWDQDFWCSPGLLLLYPDIAQSLIQYRYNLIEGARYKATTYSPPYAGTAWPWESAVSGTELASAPWGVREIHISSDIVWGISNFVTATQDPDLTWLETIAWPIVEGVAIYWMSKLALDNAGAPPGSPLHLLSVMGPDEYHDFVNNSAFTNAGAIQSLTFAAQAAQALGLNSTVYAPWLDAASRIYIPFDEVLQYHPEYDGYQINTTVKQADTIMLGFPLSFSHPSVTPQTLANDLNAYGSCTDVGGPAMTWGMFAVGYIELGAGYEGNASANFNRSFANAQEPFYVWTETPTGGCPNFLTGAGGFLQTAFSGYSGMRINATGHYFKPQLPELTKTVGIRGISFVGSRFSFSYDAEQVTVTLDAAPPSPAASGAEGRFAEASKTTVRYAHPCLFAASDTADCMRAITPPPGDSAGQAYGAAFADNSQVGRVLLGSGHLVPPRPLVLVDSKGVHYPLSPGVPVSIPLQAFSVQIAA